MRRRRRIAAEHVRPQFPVVGTYILAVVLIGLFVVYRRYVPPEGQITVRLALAGHGEEVLDRRGNKAVVIVAVHPGPNGTIGNMTIRVGGEAAEGEPIGASFDRYGAVLKKHRAELGARPSRLVLEVDGRVTYEYYMRLLDIAIEVGFADVTAISADPKKQ